MRKLLQFWQKDALNKGIVLVVLVILAGIILQVYLLAATPGGKIFVNSFFPTPTLSIDEIFNRGEQTSTAKAVETRTAVIPTITTEPFTPLAQAFTPTLTPTASVLQAAATPTGRLSTPTPATTTTPGATPTRKPASLTGSCPPGKVVQVGKVVEVVDGNTVRVLIDGLVYVVRYIGIDLPQDPAFAQLSAATNGQIVFAKEVQLYADSTDKDDNNRLLRYVVVDRSTLVNLEMIRRGLGTVSLVSFACSSDFTTAEKDAKTDHSGIWKTGQP